MPILPLRLYAEIAAALVLIAAGMWFAHHERQIGATKVEAAQAAANLKEAAHVAKVNEDATSTINDLQIRLSTALVLPAQPSFVVRVCPTASPAARIPSSDAAPVARSDDSPRPSEGLGGADIAPGTEAILKRDKAVIDYLQGYVRECQTMGNCAQ